MIYLSVIKNELGEFEIKKSFPNGTNIYGNKTGTLWHRANQMTLEERIEEGIFLQVNKSQGLDPDFSQFVRTEITFDEVNAEVVYTSIYELMDLQIIKNILKDRAYSRKNVESSKTLMFRDEKFSLDTYMMNTLNGYSSIISLGGNIPEGAVLPTKHGQSEPITNELLLEIQTFIAEHNTAVNLKFVQICNDIENATTYEDIRQAALWDGVSV